MTFLDEPKGWRKLQAMAQRENDPQKLASIIDQMNRLLDQQESRQRTRIHQPARREIEYPAIP